MTTIEHKCKCDPYGHAARYLLGKKRKFFYLEAKKFDKLFYTYEIDKTSKHPIKATATSTDLKIFCHEFHKLYSLLLKCTTDNLKNITNAKKVLDDILTSRVHTIIKDKIMLNTGGSGDILGILPNSEDNIDAHCNKIKTAVGGKSTALNGDEVTLLVDCVVKIHEQMKKMVDSDSYKLQYNDSIKGTEVSWAIRLDLIIATIGHPYDENVDVMFKNEFHEVVIETENPNDCYPRYEEMTVIVDILNTVNYGDKHSDKKVVIKFNHVDEKQKLKYVYKFPSREIFSFECDKIQTDIMMLNKFLFVSKDKDFLLCGASNTTDLDEKFTGYSSTSIQGFINNYIRETYDRDFSTDLYLQTKHETTRNMFKLPTYDTYYYFADSDPNSSNRGVAFHTKIVNNDIKKLKDDYGNFINIDSAKDPSTLDFNNLRILVSYDTFKEIVKDMEDYIPLTIPNVYKPGIFKGGRRNYKSKYAEHKKMFVEIDSDESHF